MKLSDGISWDLDCPKCRKKFKATPAELKNDPLLTCPHCGQKIQIDSGGTAGEAADALESDLMDGMRDAREGAHPGIVCDHGAAVGA